MSNSEVERLGEIFESVTDESEVVMEGDVQNDREIAVSDEFDGGDLEDGLGDAIAGAETDEPDVDAGS